MPDRAGRPLMSQVCATAARPGRRGATRGGWCSRWLLALALCVLAAGVAGARPPAPARTDIVTVHAEVRAAHLTAYARVAPRTLVRLAAARDGVVAGLSVLPGAQVAAGAVLVHLVGPQIDALLAGRRAAVDSARAALRAAQHLLAVRRQTHRLRLATEADLFRAEAAVRTAQAGLDTAEAALRAASAETTLRAPTAGVVLALRAADGEQVAARQTILVIEPRHRLWLRARYYGAEAAAVRPGMLGRFLPADGGAPVPVTVVSVLPALGPGGGLPVGLVATQGDPGWTGGAFGRVVLDGPRRTQVAVPTRALILDQGQWWVLVHTAQGDRRQEVVPGARDGAETLIARGLAPGAEVVVGNADLRFHQGVAHTYQPPD